MSPAAADKSVQLVTVLGRDTDDGFPQQHVMGSVLGKGQINRNILHIPRLIKLENGFRQGNIDG